MRSLQKEYNNFYNKDVSSFDAVYLYADGTDENHSMTVGEILSTIGSVK